MESKHELSQGIPNTAVPLVHVIEEDSAHARAPRRVAQEENIIGKPAASSATARG